MQYNPLYKPCNDLVDEQNLFLFCYGLVVFSRLIYQNIKQRNDEDSLFTNTDTIPLSAS